MMAMIVRRLVSRIVLGRDVVRTDVEGFAESVMMRPFVKRVFVSAFNVSLIVPGFCVGTMGVVEAAGIVMPDRVVRRASVWKGPASRIV